MLIVDGLDHISRVLAESPALAREDTDIVEELTTLVIPAGVRLLIGSQPGPHLRPLAGTHTEVTMPPWGEGEVWALALGYGLGDALVQSGTDEKQVRAMLWERSEGNPLYATFLVRGLLAEFQRGAVGAEEWLDSAPVIHGEIANYYAHLYALVAGDVRTIADVLGTIDFAVTEADLRSIVGPLAARQIPAAIERLRPILVEVAGQGGLRIFHESFRRFVVERFRAEGLSLSQVLDEVAAWLDRLDILTDTKAYRYLLPVLRRAGRSDEVLRRVGPDFLSESLAHGHPRPAVERNLALATEVAAAEQAWPELTRYSELWRAVHTTFEEHLQEPLSWWLGFLDVFGPDALANRLLFDGRPTFDRHLGLVLCSRLDDAGAVPPWREYLDLPRTPVSDRQGEIDHSWLGEVLAAHLHGLLRNEDSATALGWLRPVISEDWGEWEFEILAPLAERLAASGPAGSEELLLQARNATGNTGAALLLARARRRRAAGDANGAATDAEHAARLHPHPGTVGEALRAGAVELPPGFALPDPDAHEIRFDHDSEDVQRQAIQTWSDAVAVLAFRAPERLDAVEHRQDGAEWFRRWLRLILRTARAEALAIRDETAASAQAAQALRSLGEEIDPVARPAREIHLLSIWNTARDALERCLALVREDRDWAVALGALTCAASRMLDAAGERPADRILRDSLTGVLEPHAARPEVRELIRAAVDAQVQRAEAHGEYFDSLANTEMSAAQTLTAIGDAEAAKTHWLTAALYMAAYGQRKDATLYQLVEALPAFTEDRDTIVDVVERLDPLVSAVTNHTDGRGTRGLANASLRALADADPAAALALAARSQAAGGGQFGWRLEQASQDAVAAARGQGDALLVALAQSTFRFAPDYDPDAPADAERWAGMVENLAAVDPAAGAEALRRLAARVEGDHRRELPAAWEPVAAVSARLGVPVTPPTTSIGPGPETGGSDPTVIRYGIPRRVRAADAATPPSLPIPGASPLQLMAWVRHALRKPVNGGRQEVARVTNTVGYACVQLAQDGQEATAVRLIRFISCELPTFERHGGEPLADLGEGFERHELPRLAAVAYAIAFARSRGGGGWDAFGGPEHAHWLARALALDPDEGRRALAAEIVLLVQGAYVTGITPGIVRRIAAWGDTDTARACWDEAYRVIAHRLPSRCRNRSELLPFRRNDIPEWTVDEALTALIIARINHPELDRKRSALHAFAIALRERPEAIPKPLEALLAVDGAPTFGTFVLQTLLEAEPASHTVTQRIASVLTQLTGSSLFSERALAKRLLGRAALGDGWAVEPPAPELDQRPADHNLKAVYSFDTDGRLKGLAKLWPELPVHVARRFEVLAGDSAKRRMRERWDAASDRDRDLEFRIPMLFWERELAELALQEALGGIRPYLSSLGEWTADAEDRILTKALPETRLPVSNEASRSIRPALPLPTRAVDGEQGLPVLPVEDELGGWTRLAWREREYTFHRHMHWGNPSEILSVVAGAVVSAPGEQPGHAMPLGRFPARAWFQWDGLLPRSLPVEWAPPSGPVIGLDQLGGPLGDHEVLVMPPVYAVRYGLRPAIWPGPLRWLDAAGRPAVVYRSWRVRSITGLSSDEPSMLDGCELLVRPDIHERLMVDCGARMVLATRVSRREVPERREG